MYSAIELLPTRHLEGLLQIVDGIYAAACGEAPWERTLAAVCQLGALDGCALSTVDPLERRRVVLTSWGRRCAAKADAMLGAVRGDPHLMERFLRSAPGAVWCGPQISSDARPITLARTDRMQPYGFTSWACVIVGRDGRQVVCLEAYAGAGRPASSPELDNFLRRLAPHLSRAWRLGGAGRSALQRPVPAALPSRSDADLASAPDLAGASGVGRLRAEFGLTKAEARLALRLAEGSSLASAAQAFDVKLTTIRSQLQQVFAKTGTSRQTELVAMLLSCGYGPLWRPLKRDHQAAARA